MFFVTKGHFSRRIPQTEPTISGDAPRKVPHISIYNDLVALRRCCSVVDPIFFRHVRLNFFFSFSRLTHGNNVPDTNRESRAGRCAGSGAAGVRKSPKIEVLVLRQVQNRSVFIVWFSSRRDIMTSRTAGSRAEHAAKATSPVCTAVVYNPQQCLPPTGHPFWRTPRSARRVVTSRRTPLPLLPECTHRHDGMTAAGMLLYSSMIQGSTTVVSTSWLTSTA